MGRNSDICDIPLTHPLISRQHAALVFDSKGKLYGIDLGSTYGTTINEKKAKPMEYLPLEDGDILQFADTDRKFVVTQTHTSNKRKLE